jgi:hypothetical protein
MDRKSFAVGYLCGFLSSFILLFVIGMLMAFSRSAPPKSTATGVNQQTYQRVVRQAQVPRQQTLPQTHPQAPKEWIVIREWRGNATKNTERFTVGPEWCVDWSTGPGDYGPMNFQIFINKSDGGFGGVAANVIGPSQDVSYQYEAGTFYVTINTGQPYAVRVLERK